MTDLKPRIANLIRAESEAAAREAAASALHDRARQGLASAKAKAESAEGAAAVLRALADLKRQEVSDKVEGLVTAALRGVFGRPDYRFFFRWEEKRGAATAEAVLESTHQGQTVETGLVDGHGGGVLDVVAFVLRFVVARYAVPSLRKVMVLDEGFRHVSKNHSAAVGALMSGLARRTGWRFLYSTHDERLAKSADKIYRVEKDSDGRSSVTEEMP